MMIRKRIRKFGYYLKDNGNDKLSNNAYIIRAKCLEYEIVQIRI